MSNYLLDENGDPLLDQNGNPLLDQSNLTIQEILQTMLLGVTVQDDDSRLITQMDTGPSSIRRRFTAITQTVSPPIILTGAQKKSFDSWFRYTINGGTSSFQWIHPVDDSTVSYRFKKNPQFKLIRSGASDNRLWQAVLELEILP